MVFLNDYHLFCILDLKFVLCPRKPNLIKCTPLCILQTRQACVASHYLTLAGAERAAGTPASWGERGRRKQRISGVPVC